MTFARWRSNSPLHDIGRAALVVLQDRLAQLESEAEELKAAEQAAITRTENVTGKLTQLIARYKVRPRRGWMATFTFA